MANSSKEAQAWTSEHLGIASSLQNASLTRDQGHHERIKTRYGFSHPKLLRFGLHCFSIQVCMHTDFLKHQLFVLSSMRLQHWFQHNQFCGFPFISFSISAGIYFVHSQNTVIKYICHVLNILLKYVLYSSTQTAESFPAAYRFFQLQLLSEALHKCFTTKTVIPYENHFKHPE